MKTALISGISGQDGAYLAKLLLEKGYEVYGTSRDAEISHFSNLVHFGIKDRIKFESVALNDFRSVLQVLMKVKPDEIYNLAGQSSVGLSFQQPVETLESIATCSLNLLESIRFFDKPIRLYNAGSSECYGSSEIPANEETRFHPASPYAVAKAAAHWSVSSYREAYGLYACSGILFNHESPLRPERFVTKKIVAAACRIKAGLQEKLHIGNMSIQRDWGWAPEYVEAMWRMLQQEQPEDFVIATGHTYSLQQFVATAFESVELEWQKYIVCDPTMLRPTDILVGKANPEKALQKLGWSATKRMPDVVKMMVDAYLVEMRAAHLI